MRPTTRLLPLALLLAASAFADGPGDNRPDTVRPIPPKGSPVPAADAKELKAGLAELQKAIADTASALKEKPALLELLPDVQIYEKAVRWAISYDEMYVTERPKRNDVPVAKDLLKRGLERAKELRDGKPSWTSATGLVVRGYKSKIDGSVQPYGLVVPPSYEPNSAHQFRLDFWWHGRGETLTELEFIRQRQSNPGEFTPRNAFVVHPYGRYCNANKFAGEIDTFEVLEHVKKHYPIDENRIVARGFSMGGAACWQFATHYPTQWAAAAPGAGFAETKEFLNNFQNEKVQPEWWEKKLWRMYDATRYAVNLYNLPTVAYSGEKDRQKQAADVMARSLREYTLDLTHVIGAGAGHQYTPAAKTEIDRRIDSIVAAGRKTVPTSILFETYTLRYNRVGWIEVLGLKNHWERATVKAEIVQPDKITITASNITALRVRFEPGQFPFESTRYNFVTTEGWIDENFKLPPIPTDRSYTITFGEVPEGLHKSPGLQGPIDDAFLDRFLMVRPTGTPLNDAIGGWAQKEMTHAVDHWRKQFRGDAPIKDDQEVTDEDIANSNLILWGDPKSNAILARIADKLPVKWVSQEVFDDGKRWTATVLDVGGQGYDPAKHAPLLIYPNPLNPKKYVVLNSGFTFREYDYLNNARQVPKLPDYAIVDITTPPNSRFPGKVVRAGFFDEQWRIQADDGKGDE